MDIHQITQDPAQLYSLLCQIRLGADPEQGHNTSMRGPFSKELLLQSGMLQQCTLYLKEKQYKIAMILLCPVQGPLASSFLAYQKTKIAVRPLIGWDIFNFSSETVERNSTNLDRKQDLKVLYVFVVFIFEQISKQ